MQFFKNVLRGLCVFGFRSALFSFAIAIAFLATFGATDKIKSALAETNLYDIPLSNFAKQSEQNQVVDEVITISLENPLVEQAAETALPPERRVSVVTSILDGTYAWMHGDSDNPSFVIDFSEDKKRFITELTDKAFNRVEGLEVCTPAQINALNSTLNPLTINCRPPVDLQQQKQVFLSELFASELFIEDTSIKGDAVLHEVKRRVPADIVDSLPGLFQLMMLLPLIFIIIALVTGAGIVFLSKNHRKGLQKIGRVLIGTSVLLVVAGVAIYFVTQGMQTELVVKENPQLTDVAKSVFTDLRWELYKPGILITLLYAVVGGLILIILHRTKPTNPENNQAQNTHEATENPDELPAPAPQQNQENSNSD